MNRKAYGSFKGGNYMDYYEAIRNGLKDGETMGGILKDLTIGGKDLTDLGNYMNICNRLVVGDWFPLKAGQRVDMEVLIGEIPGGAFNCRLLIEQYGVKYRTAESDAGQRKALPIFKTAPVPDKLMDKMELNPAEMTADGPVFGMKAE